MNMYILGSHNFIMVGGIVLAMLLVILAVAAILMMTFVWRKKCIYISAVQNQPQSIARQVTELHIQPHINACQVKNNTVHDIEDIY